MKCDEAALLVRALVDGELDAGHGHEVEAHAKSCARCGAELAAAQEARCALGGPRLSFAAPEKPRARIERQTPVPRQTQSRRAVLKGFAVGSAASALAAATVGIVGPRRGDENRILGE